MTVIKRSLKVASAQATTLRARVRAERNLGTWKRDQRVPVTVAPGRFPVVFCTWRRLERLPQTLAMLAAQDTPVQAVIWDNSDDPCAVDRAAENADIPVTVHHSRRNIGSAARFYLGRAAGDQGHEAVVFIDDDQDFGPTTISALLSAHRPMSLSGWWAFRYTGMGYGDRERVAPGSPAAYVGAGGMICDTSVFRDSLVWRLPRRYWFVDDLWLSWVALQRGYDLFASPAQFAVIEDEHALYSSLGGTKWNFQNWLVRRHGWNPVLNPAPQRRPM